MLLSSHFFSLPDASSPIPLSALIFCTKQDKKLPTACFSKTDQQQTP